MARTCAQCNSAVPAAARFCPRCGVSVRGVSRGLVVAMVFGAAVLLVLFMMVGAVRVVRSDAATSVEVPPTVTAHVVAPAAPAPDVAR